MDDPVAVPLGFWLRRVDQLFESSLDSVLAGENLSRRLWQMLNTVARHEPATLDECRQAMALFLADAARECPPLLDELAARSWVEPQGGTYRLTTAGRTTLKALEERVTAHRAVMFAGVTDEDYRITVQTLARITGNLDPDRTGPTGI
jgi:DNA-binding MarR family transcriptional regulator